MTTTPSHIVNQLKQQKCFVLDDDSYLRMHNKLKNGSKYEWSYAHPCLHKNKSECKCFKMMNVLDKNGEMIRIVDGVQRPVFQKTPFFNALNKFKAEQN